jgi:hypothetical protein
MGPRRRSHERRPPRRMTPQCLPPLRVRSTRFARKALRSTSRQAVAVRKRSLPWAWERLEPTLIHVAASPGVQVRMSGSPGGAIPWGDPARNTPYAIQYHASCMQSKPSG